VASIAPSGINNAAEQIDFKLEVVVNMLDQKQGNSLVTDVLLAVVRGFPEFFTDIHGLV